MKKLLFSLLIFTAMAGSAFAAKPNGKTVSDKLNTVSVVKPSNLKFTMKKMELPHVYTFITSCGPWILTVADGVPEPDFFSRIAIWASFEAACVSM
ncbi:hypothetical protein [Chryseobacterium sp. G0201]|uniref:hypothetical protein n=1 Tax=Chryseobacterium sp. G0201 TaxID=2487065 RepID=UPI000F502ACE|nr:hypothetical protein [Chryseobacterium sp. G0201]AZA54539.1 hypothetical protein EG348_16840 [Chryseobacterium sp. G0201]